MFSGMTVTFTPYSDLEDVILPKQTQHYTAVQYLFDPPPPSITPGVYICCVCWSGHHVAASSCTCVSETVL